MNIINDFSKSIVFSNIEYNKPIKHSTYYQTIIKYNKQNMYLQSPFLKVVKNNFYENNNNSFFTISFLLLNNQKSKNFFKTIYDIEDYNCNIIYQNSKKWFEKNIPLNVLYKKHVQPWDINRNGQIILNFKIDYLNDNLEDFRNIRENDIISLKLLFKNINIYQSSFYSNWIIETFKNENEDDIDFYSDDDLEYSLNESNQNTDNITKENEQLEENIELIENTEHEEKEPLKNHHEKAEPLEEKEPLKNRREGEEPLEEKEPLKNRSEGAESLEEKEPLKNHREGAEPLEENLHKETEPLKNRREGAEPLLNYIENTKKNKKVKYKNNSRTSKIYRKKRILIKIPRSRKKKH